MVWYMVGDSSFLGERARKDDHDSRKLVSDLSSNTPAALHFLHVCAHVPYSMFCDSAGKI